MGGGGAHAAPLLGGSPVAHGCRSAAAAEFLIFDRLIADRAADACGQHGLRGGQAPPRLVCAPTGKARPAVEPRFDSGMVPGACSKRGRCTRTHPRRRDTRARRKGVHPAGDLATRYFTRADDDRRAGGAQAESERRDARPVDLARAQTGDVDGSHPRRDGRPSLRTLRRHVPPPRRQGLVRPRSSRRVGCSWARPMAASSSARRVAFKGSHGGSFRSRPIKWRSLLSAATPKTQAAARRSPSKVGTDQAEGDQRSARSVHLGRDSLPCGRRAGCEPSAARSSGTSPQAPTSYTEEGG